MNKPMSKRGMPGSAALAPLLAAGLSLPGAGVAAQLDPGADPGADITALEEIIITARRREETVQDVPLVIQTFGDVEIERRQIRTVGDVARYTPGFIIDQGISLQDVRPSIRGLPATRGRPPVGILVDGIDISTEALGNAGGGNLLNLRLLDLERIEVVKGPQSALYGRAAFAGAVNYVSKRPTDELEMRLNAGYGRFDSYDVNGSISGPLIEDRLQARLNASYASSDGDYDNPVSGGDLNGFRSAGVGLALQFTPTDALTVYARASYSDDRADQRAIQSLSGFTGAVSRPGPDTDAGRAIATAVEAGVLPPGFGPSNTPSPGDLLFTGVTGLSVDPRTGEDFPGSDSETILATVNIEWDVGAMTLVSLTGYAGQEDVLRYDGDFFGLPDQTFVDGVAEPLELFDAVDFRNDYDQISQELRLQNFDAERVRWAVGGLYWDSSMDQDNNSLRALGGFPFDGFTPPVAALSGSTLFANSIPFSVPQGRDIESWSIYGLVEVDVTSRLRVSAELRYIDEEQTVTRSEFTQTRDMPLLAPLPAGTEQATVGDNAFLPRLSVDYGLGDDTIVYASIARGFKPGGVSELNFGTPLADSRFDAETLWNYELGVKSTLLDGQMFLNGAVFYMDWNDLQTTRLQENPDTASGVSNIVLNAGGAEVIGLDLSATVKPAVIDGLVLSVGYTFLDAEYTDFTEPATSPLPITDAGNCTVATVAGATVCNVTLNGNRLERAPRHSLTANIYYERPVTDGLSAFIDVAVQYQSDRFLQSGNNFVLPSYTNVDLSVGVQTDRWTAQFYTTNATGSDTVRTAQENFDLSTFGRSVNLFAPPRTAYGVRVGYRY